MSVTWDFSLLGCLYTRFFYKQHFYKQSQSEIGIKIRQILSNTLRLNFCYLIIIHILHPRYHAKIIGYTLKISKRACNHDKNEDENENRKIDHHKDMKKIDLSLDMDTNIVNIKSVSV